MDSDQLHPGIERQNMILAWLNGRYHQREARAGEVPLAQIDRRTWAGRTAEISVERYDLDLVLRDRATQLVCDPEAIVACGPRGAATAVGMPHRPAETAGAGLRWSSRAIMPSDTRTGTVNRTYIP